MRHVLLSAPAIALLMIVTARAAEPADLLDCRSGATLTDRALRGDASALATLRDEGPAGLRQLLEACGPQIAKSAPRPNSLPTTAPADSAGKTEQARMRSAIDAVAAQRDAWAAKLYWYTDLAKARAAAQSEHKPILSLRLLGRLDQELSCANSRFFRTTLYPDPQVNNLLRDRFILYWSSERPVPVITIDFGDGRMIKRTIGGNSIHYVLDEEGRPIDGIPGLYSASEFVRQLRSDLELCDKLAGLSGSAWQDVLTRHHQEASNALEHAWKQRLAKAKLDSISPEQASNQVWQTLAEAQGSARLSPEVVAIVALKAPPIERAERLTASKAAIETPLVQAIGRLQESIAQDTLRDEFGLHRQIHQWFASPVQNVTGDFQALNNTVYSKLFLTPRSDPWLGLAPPDVYSAIESGGLARR
jgi:hypothetical protein